VTGRPEVRVRVFKDMDELSRAAADFFKTIAQESIVAKGRFAVALSGGSTPRLFYSLLGSSPYVDAMDWSRIHIFWADERCVSQDQPESNYKLAYDMFLSRVPIQVENIHRIRGEEGPDKAAQAYEYELRDFISDSGMPIFDLVILGTGEDGHTASLFPGSDAVLEMTMLAVPVFLERPKISRVTLTLSVLNHTAHVLFLAAGCAKADIVRDILEGGETQAYPAGQVRPVSGDVFWFIDRQAAGKLRTRRSE
jgi:6-phosphogluconolactonase